MMWWDLLKLTDKQGGKWVVYYNPYINETLVVYYYPNQNKEPAIFKNGSRINLANNRRSIRLDKQGGKWITYRDQSGNTIIIYHSKTGVYAIFANGYKVNRVNRVI